MDRAVGKRRVSEQPKTRQLPVASGGSPVVITLIVVSFLVPSSFEVLSLRFDPLRLAMLVSVVPLTLAWLARRGGPVIPVDLLIMAHAAWIIASLVVNEGVSRFPYATMLAVEVFGGYLVGRTLISDIAAYRTLFRVLMFVFIVLTPFAIYELLTGKAIMQTIAQTAFGTSHGDVQHNRRLGLYRVQSIMQHPILFGVFCSVAIANLYYINKLRPISALTGAGLALWLTFSSLSSGALLAGIFQLGMITWDRVSKGAWKIVVYTAAAVYVFLSFASNRGPVVLMIETLTFNADTGWYRIHQWRHGIDDAKANPIFGIGLGDWSRPYWLSDSVDNFWLLTAMRYGIVGFLFLAIGIAWHLRKVVTARNLTDEEQRIRTGYVVGLASLCVSMATVHIWGPPYVFFSLYIGAGVWLYSNRSEGVSNGPLPEEDEALSEPSRYTRFAPRSTRPDAKPVTSSGRSAANTLTQPKGSRGK